MPRLCLLLGTTWAQVEELDLLLVKADYRVMVTRCSGMLQAVSKALGKNPPCSAGPSCGGAWCPREAFGGGVDSSAVGEAFQEGFYPDMLIDSVGK